MHLLAFDGRLGASGDMILGALLSAGANPGVLDPIEAALEVEYRIGETTKCGISATTVDVLVTGDDSADASGHEGEDHDGHSHGRHEHNHDDTGHDNGHGTDGHEHSHGVDDNHSHDHDHNHSHDHDHNHDNDHEHVHAEGHGPHRSYLEVRELVEGMGLESELERDALAIFELLGEAEASVHGESLEEIHFHEVGADDAIADIVGAVALLADLAPDCVVTTPLSVGGGTLSMSHGEYPVPAPAVVELAARADWSLRGGPLETELLTPTGAAILAHVAEGVETLPSVDLESMGYGAGSYDLDPHPNVLRVLVGEGEGELVRDEIAVLETNVDDATPEVLGGLQESLAAVGARDVSVVPATMKKSRPGHLVTVICKPEDRQRVARRLAAETGTLGIRDAGATHRWIANRELETATLEIDGDSHAVGVKVASDADGEVYDVSAEYDDAAALAAETGLPVRTVIQRAERALERERV